MGNGGLAVIPFPLSHFPFPALSIPDSRCPISDKVPGHERAPGIDISHQPVLAYTDYDMAQYCRYTAASFPADFRKLSPWQSPHRQ